MRKVTCATVLTAAFLVASWTDAARAGLFERRKGGGVQRQENPEDVNANRLLKKAQVEAALGHQDEYVSLLKAIPDRYPTSVVRFDAYFNLGDHYMQLRQFDDAIQWYNRVIREGQLDLDEQDPKMVKAYYKMGEAYYHAGKYSSCITQMRKVVGDFAGSDFANVAYYYIGMCHFKNKRWSKAIESLQLVGTDIPEDAPHAKRIEAKKRFYIKVSDTDLTVLRKRGEDVYVEVQTKRGDKEKVELRPLNLKGDIYLGSISTNLGEASPNDETLDIYGEDEIAVRYLDENTAEGERHVDRPAKIRVVGNGAAAVVDGAYEEPVEMVVLGEKVCLRVTDYDLDVTTGQDELPNVRVRVREPYERILTDEEIAEMEDMDEEEAYENRVRIEYRDRDEIFLTLSEQELDEPVFSESMRKAIARKYLKSRKDLKDKKKVQEAFDNADKDIARIKAKARRDKYHTGVFIGAVELAPLAEDEAPNPNDTVLEARPGDVVEIEYIDNLHLEGESPNVVTARASVLEPKESNVTLVQTVEREIEYAVRKKLLSAEALLHLGQIFQDLGLYDRAEQKFRDGLKNLDDVAAQRKQFDRKYLLEMYRINWQIRAAMGDLAGAANVCSAILRDFPRTVVAEQALLQLGRISRDSGNHVEAVRFFAQLANLPGSTFAAEAQYEMGMAYEKGGQGPQALQAYEACARRFPDTDFAGKAVVKIVAFYLNQNDLARAKEKLQKIMVDFADEPFMPLVHYHLGMTLYKLKDIAGAVDQWRRIVSDYPDSEYAPRVRQYIDKLAPRLAASKGGE